MGLVSTASRRAKLAAVILLALTACNNDGQIQPHPAPPITSAQQLGSVHVSQLSVNRWEDYIASLQPQFPMTAATALTLALPRTFNAQNAIANNLSAGLQVGLPQTTTTNALTQALTNGVNTSGSGTASGGTTFSNGLTNNTSTTGGVTTPTATTSTALGSTGSTATTSTTTTNGSATTTQTTTTQQGPGTLPASVLPAVTLPNAAGLTAPSGTTQFDPLLTYTAARAVYEEVQLINHEVQDAALRHDYVPYLVRLQVSVVPFARNEPYDVYVNIGAFSTCGDKAAEQPTILIPLLVTDDVETGQETNAQNIASQLAGSIGGTISNVALQAQLSNLRNKFNAILATDFNSLYMVSRASDNVIQVRLGASKSANPDATGGYAMLTQTHDVSFVMLVNQNNAPNTSGECSTTKLPGSGAPPVLITSQSVAQQALPPVAITTGPAEIKLTSYARFRNAITGQELPISRTLIDDQLKVVLDRFVNPDQAKALDALDAEQFKATYGALIGYVQTKDLNGFYSECESRFGPKPGTAAPDPCISYEALWTGLTSVVTMSEYDAAVVELPLRQMPEVPLEQAIFLHDDCKATVTATVGGFGTLLPNQFNATLILTDASATVAATSITQATAGGPFTLQFPTLKPYSNLAAVAKACPAAPAANPMHALAAQLQTTANQAQQKAETSAAQAKLATATQADKDAATADATAAANAAAVAKAANDDDTKDTSPAAPSTPLPASPISGTLTLTEINDSRWVTSNPNQLNVAYTFPTLYYDGTTIPPTTSVTLTAATDTISTDSTQTGTLRLTIAGGTGLDEVDVSVSGASISALPVNPAVSAPSATATIVTGFKVATGGATGMAAPAPVVVDIPLAGLVPSRVVTITATGKLSGKAVPGAIGETVVPIIASASATPKTSTTGSTP